MKYMQLETSDVYHLIGKQWDIVPLLQDDDAKADVTLCGIYYGDEQVKDYSEQLEWNGRLCRNCSGVLARLEREQLRQLVDTRS